MEPTTYPSGMSTTHASNAPNPEERMHVRGKILGKLLEDERWSNRQAGVRLGLSHRYIGDRVNGKVDITFSDVEAFAGLLEMTPTELFLKLLGPYSKREPIGSRLAPVTQLSDRPRKPANGPTPPLAGTAVISRLHA